VSLASVDKKVTAVWLWGRKVAAEVQAIGNRAKWQSRSQRWHDTTVSGSRAECNSRKYLGMEGCNCGSDPRGQDTAQ
jgi:hypothetical protein